MSYAVYEDEDADLGGFTVRLPSGARLPVANMSEQRHGEDMVRQYTDHNQLVNISDLAEMDRLIGLELIVYRNMRHLMQGEDDNGERVNDKELNALLNQHSTEIRLIKKNLGLDRPARERAKGEGSIPAYWENLQVRARAFGIMRVQQLDRAIELTNELISWVQRHDNATERERTEYKCTIPDIVDWIRNVYIPEFTAIDEHFRNVTTDDEYGVTGQRYWVRTQ